MFLNAVGGVCRYWEVEEIVSKGIEGTRYMLREEIMLQRQLITHKINPLKPKRRPLYLKTQSVPRCKHFSSRVIKTNQFML